MRTSKPVEFMNTDILIAYFIKPIILYALPEFFIGHIQNIADTEKLGQKGRKRPVKSSSLTLF